MSWSQLRRHEMNEQGQWQVAGSAPEVYERELVPAIFGPWVPIVIDLAHPRPGDRVLDVVCGTGIVMRAVAERVGPTGCSGRGRSQSRNVESRPSLVDRGTFRRAGPVARSE